MKVVSVRLDDEQAIRDCMDSHVWQATEIRQAIIESEQDDFIPENELNTLFKKMGVVV